MSCAPCKRIKTSHSTDTIHFVACASAKGKVGKLYAHATLPLNKISEVIALTFSLTKTFPHMEEFQNTSYLNLEKGPDTDPTMGKSIAFIESKAQENPLVDPWQPTTKVTHLLINFLTPSKEAIGLKGLVRAIGNICSLTFPNLIQTESTLKVHVGDNQSHGDNTLIRDDDSLLHNFLN